MSREKLVTQVDTEVLTAVLALAEKEGRDLQDIVEEALRDLVDKHQATAAPRAHVVAAYESSHVQFGSLYKKLAE
jgi:predicted transcriptional regulator